MRRPIVVGVDGSEEAAAALRWAVEEGERSGAPVTAILAWSYLDQHEADGGEGFDPAYGEADARAALRSFVSAAVGDHRDIRQEVVCDLPTRAIAERSELAGMVVVGATGEGGFLGLRLGSTSAGLLTRSAAPVAIVRGEPREGPVLVGVDGSPQAGRVLRVAVEQARLRGTRLVAVSTWSRPALARWAFTEESPLFASLARHQEAVLAAAVADVDTSGVTVEQRVLEGSAAGNLLALEHDLRASLVVIGSRGAPAPIGAALGSVSRQVAHHAAGPVLVVRP
jgi:nucleotide-binding universal stress UspA family protein